MQLKPFLLRVAKSEFAFNKRSTISFFSLVMASCSGVSPSLSCTHALAPKFNNTLTTSMRALLTAMCSAVCCFSFIAFICKLLLWDHKSSITAGSLPNAAWWIARSPSLSFFFLNMFYLFKIFQIKLFDELNLTSISTSALWAKRSFTMFMWPFWQAACKAVWPPYIPLTFSLWKKRKKLFHLFFWIKICFKSRLLCRSSSACFRIFDNRLLQTLWSTLRRESRINFNYLKKFRIGWIFWIKPSVTSNLRKANFRKKPVKVVAVMVETKQLSSTLLTRSGFKVHECEPNSIFKSLSGNILTILPLFPSIFF